MSTCSRLKLEVFSEDISHTVLIVKQSGHEVQVVSCLVSYILHSAWFAWCLVFCFRDGTLAHWVTHSVAVSSGPHSRPPEACAIHGPTHPVPLVAYTSES